MYYAIMAQDIDNSLELRKATRPAHLEYVGKLHAQGRVILAGPHPAVDSPDPQQAGFTGSLLVVEFDNLQQAQDWVAQDPYMLEGVYQCVQVKPFNKVLPA